MCRRSSESESDKTCVSDAPSFSVFSTSVGVHEQVGVIQLREENPADKQIRPVKPFVGNLSRNGRSKVKLSRDSSIRVAACAVKVNMPQSKSHQLGPPRGADPCFPGVSNEGVLFTTTHTDLDRQTLSTTPNSRSESSRKNANDVTSPFFKDSLATLCTRSALPRRAHFLPRLPGSPSKREDGRLRPLPLQSAESRERKAFSSMLAACQSTPNWPASADKVRRQICRNINQSLTHSSSDQKSAMPPKTILPPKKNPSRKVKRDATPHPSPVAPEQTKPGKAKVTEVVIQEYAENTGTPATPTDPNHWANSSP